MSKQQVGGELYLKKHDSVLPVIIAKHSSLSKWHKKTSLILNQISGQYPSNLKKAISVELLSYNINEINTTGGLQKIGRSECLSYLSSLTRSFTLSLRRKKDKTFLYEQKIDKKLLLPAHVQTDLDLDLDLVYSIDRNGLQVTQYTAILWSQKGYFWLFRASIHLQDNPRIQIWRSSCIRPSVLLLRYTRIKTKQSKHADAGQRFQERRKGVRDGQNYLNVQVIDQIIS